MIDKYEKIVGDLELLDTKRNRDKLVFSYLISDTFEKYNSEIIISIDLTNFLNNVCIDEDYNFMYIDDKIEYIKYKFIVNSISRKGIWQSVAPRNEIKRLFIRFGVDEKDVNELIEEIIEDLTYDAIEKLNYLVCEDLNYYLRRDEIC